MSQNNNTNNLEPTLFNVSLCKFRVLDNVIFRRNNPCTFGVEILAGRLTPNTSVMNVTGDEIGIIRQISQEGPFGQEANKGDKVAVIMEKLPNKNFNEGEELYSLPSSMQAKLLQENSTKFPEASLIKDIIATRRQTQPAYAT